MDKDIFRHADQSLMVIFNAIAKEYQRLGQQLGFDELNVLETRKTVNTMYKRIDDVIQREFRKVCLRAYTEAGGKRDVFDPQEYVYVMFHAYDPLTAYVYTREFERKRDRLFESIIATQTGNQEMRRNLKRNMDVLANQVRQYADSATIRARIQAFRDIGVEYVMWVTEKDDRVCATCAPRDGVIYRIDELPDMPAHFRCRCALIPATEEEYQAQRH